MMASEGVASGSRSAFVFCQKATATRATTEGTAEAEQQTAAAAPLSAAPIHPKVAALSAPSISGTSENASSRAGEDGIAAASASFQPSSTAVASGEGAALGLEKSLQHSSDQDSLAPADRLDDAKTARDGSFAPIDTVIALTDQDDEKRGHVGAKDQLDHQDAKQGTVQSVYLVNDDVLLSIALHEGHTWRLALWYLLCFLSIGILVVVGHWYPRIWLRWNTSPVIVDEASFPRKRRARLYAAVAVGRNTLDICRLRRRTLYEPLPSGLVFPPSIKIPPLDARSTPTPLPQIALGALHEKSSTLDIENSTGEAKMSDIIELDYRSTKFLLHPSGSLVLLADWRDPTWVSTSALARGVGERRRSILADLLGKNLIDLKGRSALEIFISEGLHPFNIFQVYSIILWCNDDYVPYAIVIAVITIIGISLTVIETKRSIARMRKMSRFVCQVRRLRRTDEGEAAKVASTALEKSTSDTDTVSSRDVWDIVDSTTLVPGDVIDLAAIDEGKVETVPCDCVLLESDAIVSEAMLTGESVPVAKAGISNADVPQLQTASRGSRLDKYCVFGGTQLVRARPADEKEQKEARAVVIQTGFSTAKGSLIRQMLFPREVNFKFYKDAFMAIGVLFGIACLGLIASAIYFVHIGVDPGEIAVRSLDVLTISVPPALPAALSIAITFALARLRRRQIFCTSPQRINVAGMVTAIVFDKTGTLTQEGLSVLGVCHPQENGLSEACKTHDDLLREQRTADESGLMFHHALATTHDLNYYSEELLGEPLESAMFAWTGAELSQDEAPLLLDDHTSATTMDGRQAKSKIVDTVAAGEATEGQGRKRTRLAIVRQFEFVAGLRRMSVVVKQEADPASYVFVKGAAESIGSLCRPDSFPPGYEGQIDRWTHGGYRVLALAGKRIDELDWAALRTMKRGLAESDLTFLGLLVFENKLKDGTCQTLSQLHDGGIITKMCTGDAPLTAISVARECGIVSSTKPVFMARISGTSSEDDASPIALTQNSVEWVDVDDQQNKLDAYSLEPTSKDARLTDVGLCVSGETYAHMMAHSKQETIERLLVQGQVFARFSPEQKQDLVERLQRIDYTVAMVGDGANDMGALKSADVGLSLSQAEASVAAPFTSEKIQAIEELCREGRNAVSSSVALFNFFFLYGLTEYFTVLLLYGAPFFSTTMNNAEYLWIDIFLVFPSVFGISASRPSKRLVNQSVRTRIITRRNMTSIFGQMVLMILAQMTTYLALHRQSFYKPPDYDPEDIVTYSQDNTAIFRAGNFTYLIVALVWNLGPPHRRMLPRNYLLSAAVIILGTFNFYFLFCTSGALFDLFELESSLKPYFNWIILGIVVAQLLFAMLVELIVVDKIAALLFRPLRALRTWYAQSVRHQPAPPSKKRHRIIADAIRRGG